MDLAVVFGILVLVVALILLVIQVRKNPAGMRCHECGDRNVALISKEPLKFMHSDNSASPATFEGYAVTQVRYRFKYKCPKCNAEQVVEAGDSS